jgi:hypothetical protein
VSEKDRKYASALAAVNQSPPSESQLLLPPKPEAPRGKRSTPGWKPKQALLKEATIACAELKLKFRKDRTDFSDMVQALLEGWLRTSE